MSNILRPPVRVRRRRNSCDNHLRRTKGCAPCRARSSRCARERGRLKAGGNWDGAIVDATPAQNYLGLLTGAPFHMSLVQISRAAGVAERSVYRIASQSNPRAVKYTVDAILGVKPAPPAKRLQRVPAHGTARRLQALTAEGFDSRRQAEMLQASLPQVQGWRSMRRQFVSAVTAARVKHLFARIAGTTGPSDEARELASRRRWMRHDEWIREGEDRIDDPDAPLSAYPDGDAVDEQVVAEALRGRVPLIRLTTPEKWLLYRLWRQQRVAAGQRIDAKLFSGAFRVSQWQGRLIAQAVNRSDMKDTDAASGGATKRKAA